MNPLKWVGSPQGLSGLDEEDLRGILEKVPTGWLMVLGKSGSGKSMLMLRTVREIIDHREPGDMVPVFVPMASWNPRKDSLRTWLEKQLLIDYPGLGASVTEGSKRTTLITTLLDEQKIILILDGLDEMPVTAQVAAVNQLNRAFSANARPLRLVVTCRTGDYRRAVLGPPGEKGRKPNPLVAAAAIELDDLDADKVSYYLTRRGADERWAAVGEQLRQHGELARALNTPLYASLASEIYNPSRPEDLDKLRDPAELSTLPGEEAVHHYLLDEFIPAVYADEQAKLDTRAADEYEAPKQLPAERWLMILADYLTSGRKETATSLEWWDLRGLAPSRLVPVVLGAVCGIASGVAAATGTHVGVGIGIGFGTGMLIAIVIGIAFYETRRRWDEGRLSRGRLSKQAFDKHYKRRRPGPGMSGGMIGAVIGGVAAGIAGKYHIGHQASLFSGVPEGLGMALGAGASTDFVGGFVGVLSGSFAGGCLAAVGLGPPAGVVNGLGVGVAVAIVIERVGRHKPSRTRPQWDKEIGVPGGIVIGLAIGLIVWREIGLTYGIVCGVLMAAIAAAPFGLRHADANLEEVPSPGQALATDTKAFWITALSAGMAAGAAGFLGGGMTSITEVHAKASVGLLIGDGLGIGIASGLVVGLTFGLYHAASPEFRIITAWMGLRGKAPWRFKHFLDEAYRLTVLRQSGAAYQFRHIELQLRLASRYESGKAQPETADALAPETSSTPAGQVQEAP
jgi:NACHT domain